jgi:hypothetical protein
VIGKKIANPKKSASKAARVNLLSEYIREPELRSQDEKCIYAGANGFLSDDAKAGDGGASKQRPDQSLCAELARR